MTQASKMESEAFEGKRITIASSKTYDEVLSKLYASIGSTDKMGAWQTIASNIKSYSDEAREEFISATNKVVGPHGFMIFQEFDHGAWISLFGTGNGLKMKRIILGNPLIAITMLKHDLYTGLFVPVEILVKEKEAGKGTEVVYVLPSCLIAGINKDEKLVEAVGALDGKLEALVKDVLA